MDLVGAIEKLNKGFGSFQTRLYKRVVAVCPTPRIFVSAATSPMNMRGLYLSMTWLHR
jgi:hypothetical protein